LDELGDIAWAFFLEPHENLDQLDSDPVVLELAPDSRELLSSIFRAIHTNSGASIDNRRAAEVRSATHTGKSRGVT
jgi:two-component system, chemotaxis family, sensor kinase CheA